jgi:hypothetical protein
VQAVQVQVEKAVSLPYCPGCPYWRVLMWLTQLREAEHRVRREAWCAGFLVGALAGVGLAVVWL